MLGLSKLFIEIVLIFKLVEGWSWQCSNVGLCSRTEIQATNQTTYSSLELCHLVCGDSEYLNVWPYPTGSISALKQIVNVNTENINFQMDSSSEAKAFLGKNIQYFKDKIMSSSYHCQKEMHSMNIFLRPISNSITLNMKTDESYTLQMDLNDNVLNVEILGNSIYGVRHGIETLLQLLVPYKEKDEICLASLKSLRITDKPVYVHRGLLLDTARNYLSSNVIKRNIDGMAASKMNVLHWHIVDSQSFPFESPSMPNMTKYGAYSSKMIYTSETIKDLVEYANIRGVRILMEIDGPSHAGNGWQWGNEAGLGNLSLCVNQQPWRSFCIQPPCGQLNPINPNVYRVLNALYRDISNVVPDSDLFHLGGDEVFIPCWNSTQEIIEHLNGQNMSSDEPFLDLWAEYQNKALAAYDAAVGHDKTTVAVWTSHLTMPEYVQKYLPKERYVIHAWIPEADNYLITDLLKLGYKMILSTKDRWYLDHGFWGTTPYYNWRRVYQNKMYSEMHPGILGGEVCMWGELVDDSNIEPRIWPRAAAAAERLWSNPEGSASIAEPRFFSHRERLVNRGIHAEAPTPKWCVQSEGGCSEYLSYDGLS